MAKKWHQLLTNVISGRKTEGTITGRTSHFADRTESVIYNGLISPRVLEMIQGATREGYLFAIEVRSFPDHRWYGLALKQRTWTHMGEDCMGGQYTDTRTGPLYRVIRRSLMTDDQGFCDGGFLMLLDQSDYEMALSHLDDLIIHPSPFKTLIRTTNG